MKIDLLDRTQSLPPSLKKRMCWSLKNYEERIQEWQELAKSITSFGGILPSPPDPRDYSVEDIPMATAVLPPKVQLTPSPIILDQGQTGYCAGASGAGVVNAYYHSHECMPDKGFSMAFLYWLCKEHDGIPHINGTYISTLCKMMRHYGCAPEVLAPYSPRRINITEKALKAAEQYKIEAYARLITLEDIKQAYAKGLYVIYGTLVTSDNWQRTYLSYPKGRLYGGHATHGFGYDDYLKREHIGYFTNQNSWGLQVHTGGRFFMPYDIMKMRFDGRPYFLEAWGIKFYDLDEDGKKKEPLSPKPNIPQFIRPQIDLNHLRDTIRQQIEEHIRRIREQLQRR